MKRVFCPSSDAIHPYGKSMAKSLANRRDVLALASAGVACAVLPAYAVDAPKDLKIISKIPRAPSDIRRDHGLGQRCDQLPKGEVIVLNSFAAYLTDRDRKDAERLAEKTKKRSLPNPSTRTQLMSVGIQVDPAFVPQLPKLSAGQIIKYVDEHFVSVQAKIQKDPARGVLYLHHRPYVATAPYNGARITEAFTAAVGSSVGELRSMGLFVPPGKQPTPENLRTVVLMHKHEAAVAGGGVGKAIVEDHFEYIFVRGKSMAVGNRLDLHAFGTSDERKKLHYFRAAATPKRPAECTLLGEVYFTKYINGGLEPSEAVMRGQRINAQASFTMRELDTFVKSKLGLQGDVLDNLTEVLDAIIDGRVKPSGAANEKATAAVAAPAK